MSEQSLGIQLVRCSPRMIASTLLFFAVLVESCDTAYAYDKDTHYAFTYFMAVTSGYTPLQAQRIASADVGIDYSPDTEPVQGAILDPNTYSSDAQSVRVHYHAMLDQVNHPYCIPGMAKAVHRDLIDAIAEMDDIDAKLLTFGKSTLRNPGVYLHFLQDRYAHWGYGSRHGHYKPYGNMPFGSGTDYLSFDPTSSVTPKVQAMFNLPPTYDYASARNEKMVRATLIALQQFRISMPPISQGLCEPLPNADINCKNLLLRLRSVNPVPYWKSRGSDHTPPDYSKAEIEVNAALKRIKAFDDLPERIKYRFRIKGLGGPIELNEELRDEVTLYGDLTLRLPEGTHEDARITLRLAQTRMDEKPVALTITPQRVDSRSIKFVGCPVGVLIVSIATPYGDTMDYTVAVLDRDNQIELSPLKIGIRRIYSAGQNVWHLCIAMGALGIYNARPPFFADLKVDPPNMDALKNSIAAVNKEFRDYADELKQARITIGGRTLPISKCIPKFPYIAAIEMASGYDKDEKGRKIKGRMSTALYRLSARYDPSKADPHDMERAYPMCPDTEIECQISDEQIADLHGPICVTYRNRTWEVGWIGSFDIKIVFKKGFPETGSQGGFNPSALEIRGEGTLTTHILLVKPLQTVKPPLLIHNRLGTVLESDPYEDLFSSDHYEISEKALFSKFRPTAFVTVGALHSYGGNTTVRGTVQKETRDAGVCIVPTAKKPGLDDYSIKYYESPLCLEANWLLLGKFQLVNGGSPGLGSPGTEPRGRRRNLNDLFPDVAAASPKATQTTSESASELPGQNLYITPEWCFPYGIMRFVLTDNLSVLAGNYQITAKSPSLSSSSSYPYKDATDKSGSYSYSLSWPASALDLK